MLRYTKTFSGEVSYIYTFRLRQILTWRVFQACWHRCVINHSLTSPDAPWALHEKKKKKKLPSSSSSSPALIAHRMQSTVVWDRSCSVRVRTSAPVLQRETAGRWMLVGWRTVGSSGRRNTAAACVNVLETERSPPLTHSLPVTFYLLVWVSNTPSAAPCRSPPT